MSKVKIQGNASGTGVVTLTAPNTNTDRTITLPDGDITLGVGIDDNATSTAITIDSSENTTFDGGTNYPIKWTGAGGAATGSLYGDGSSVGLMYGDSSFATGLNFTTDTLKFRTGSTERMRIDSSGRVGINGSPTQARFEVAETANTQVPVRINDTSNTATNTHRIRFDSCGTEVGRILANSTSVTYATSSDYRLKENVVPMSGSIDRLKALKPSKFNFIAEPLNVVDGFLAHEAGEVVPECVHGTKDAMKDEEYEVTPAVMDGETIVTKAVMGTRSVPDYQGIDQSKLVPLLVASLQEAIARIEQLENA